MTDVELLEAYKDAYRQSELWAPLQYTQRDKSAEECFNLISPIPKKETKIYVTPPKMKDFKYEKANSPLFYINQAKAYAAGKLTDLRSGALRVEITSKILVGTIITVYFYN